MDPAHPLCTGIHGSSLNQVPPANALTLDEVHARENIQPSPSKPPTDSTSTGEGMEAFNKLLAVLESKQSVSPSHLVSSHTILY